jgi:hypothetical protein
MRIENAGNSNGRGKVVFRDKVDLLSGRSTSFPSLLITQNFNPTTDPSEMVIQIPKVRGHYTLELSNSTISSRKFPSSSTTPDEKEMKEARRVLREAWFGVKLPDTPGFGWKSGPVAR